MLCSYLTNIEVLSYDGLLMSFSSPMQREAAAARWAFAVAQLELRRLRFALLLRKGYNPNQLRVPAGNPNGGEWTSGGGAAQTTAPRQEEDRRLKPQNRYRLAGGFAKEQLGMSVQSFVSAHCKGRIRSVLPQQFLELTIVDVMQAAKQGDKAARTCLKILGRDEYRK